MAIAAALKSIDSLTGVDARMEALDRLEKLTDEVAAEIARHKSNVLLKRGIKAWRRGEIVRAGQWALKSSEMDPSNAKAFHVLAMALFIIMLVEFLLVQRAATSTFFLLMAIALVDVLAGFIVGMRSATRQIEVEGADRA